MYKQLSIEKRNLEKIRNAVILSSTLLETAVDQIVNIVANKLHISIFQKMLKRTFVPVSVKIQKLHSQGLIGEDLHKNMVLLFKIRNKFAHQVFSSAKEAIPTFTPLNDAKTKNTYLQRLPNDSVKFELFVSKCFVEMLLIAKKLDPESVMELELVGEFKPVED